MRSGSPQRLFLLIYVRRHAGDGVPVQRCDGGGADAGGLCRGARRQGAEPLPYLLICAFIANAASFVLPISNPANLVIFGSAHAAAGRWLRRSPCPRSPRSLLTYRAAAADAAPRAARDVAQPMSTRRACSAAAASSRPSGIVADGGGAARRLGARTRISACRPSSPASLPPLRC